MRAHCDDRGGWRIPTWLLARIWQDSVGLLGVVALPLLCGCGATKYLDSNRLQHGYTVVLPGIEGASFLNTSIAKGLRDAGWPAAIEVYDWTAGSVILAPLSLRALERNKREARTVARKIIEYQDRYPERPVHIIGHSGGGGVAILTLEALPPDRQITSAILLAPALSPDYDLRRAMRRTKYGIWNYYSRHDVGFLKAGTTVMGTIDGQHTSAAGAVGFHLPWGLDDDDRRLYSTKLHQQPYSRKMAEAGHSGGHMGWANRRFVASWIYPVMASQVEPEPEFAADTNSPRRAAR